MLFIIIYLNYFEVTLFAWNTKNLPYKRNAIMSVFS